MKTVEYPIHEHFYSIQGEGKYTGYAAYFVRTMFCPVKCGFCDVAGTWHKDWQPKDYKTLEPRYLASFIKRKNPPFVVITGGEPALFDWKPLFDEFHGIYPLHLETSGAVDIKHPEVFQHIVMSPKKSHTVPLARIALAHELKFIVESWDDFAYYTNLYNLDSIETPVIWHLEWSKKDDDQLKRELVAHVQGSMHKHHRIGWQLHKLLRADEMDRGTRPPVPLGGKRADI